LIPATIVGGEYEHEAWESIMNNGRNDCQRISRRVVLTDTALALGAAAAATVVSQATAQEKSAHHDAVEFPDGQIVLLTFLCEGQQATVLQLPAEPKTIVETEAQQRAAYAG
jgi:hypothetical protein